MLILSRKQGEALVIEIEGRAEPIEITTLEVGLQVRIGIEAPTDCKVWRKELYLTMLENKQATQNANALDVRKIAQGLFNINKQ